MSDWVPLRQKIFDKSKKIKTPTKLFTWENMRRGQSCDDKHNREKT